MCCLTRFYNWIVPWSWRGVVPECTLMCMGCDTQSPLTTVLNSPTASTPLNPRINANVWSVTVLLRAVCVRGPGRLRARVVGALLCL